MKYRFLRFPEGKTKAVTFSYDDASKTDLRLADVFDRYGMKCTFNVNSLYVLDENRENSLHVNELRDLVSRGHEIALHGHSHKAHALISPTDAVRETLECRIQLEKAFGMIIRGMAYPDCGIRRNHNGNDYSTVRSILRNVGVVYSRTLGRDNDDFALPDDWYAWMPSAHHDNPEIFNYIDKFLSLDVNRGYCSGHWPRLLYIWGHSFEFERKNNWEQIDQICERLCNKDDIWYATGIEIYDYVTAYNSLVISADSTMFYNPTLITVWFAVGDDTYSIAPGETLRIED